MKLRFKIRDIFFFVCTSFCCISRLYPYTIHEYVRLVVLLLWIVFSYGYKVKGDRYERKSAKELLELHIVPVIYMIIYTLIIWAINPPKGTGTVLGYYTRLLSTNVILIAFCIYAYRAYTIYGEKLIDMFWRVLIVVYSVTAIIRAMVFCGVVDVLKNIIFQPDQSMVNNYLEVHDLTFALGYYLIYYIVFGKRYRVNHLRKKTIMTIVFIWIGFKRIELLAVFIVSGFYMIFDKYWKKRNKKYVIFGVASIIVGYIFIWIIYSGLLSSIALSRGINFNYRLDTWTYWSKQSFFGLGYLGKGLTYVDKETNLLLEINGRYTGQYAILSGMHSDLFKKYIELGFVPCLVWLIYILISKTIILGNHYNVYVSEMYFLLMLYTFILYLTDNVFNYGISNIAFIILPMAVAIKEKEWSRSRLKLTSK